MKKFLAVLILALFAWWWFFLRDAPEPAPGARLNEAPEQAATREPAFTAKGYEIQPLASYRIQARVLSKKRYRLGDFTDIAPFDLALGWQGMSDTAVLRHISISQSSRWYEYWYDSSCPLPPNEVAVQSANVHCLPANDVVMDTLKSLRRNSLVDLEGYLVEVRPPGKPPLRSSLVRDDEGGGACEVFWITGAIELPH